MLLLCENSVLQRCRARLDAISGPHLCVGFDRHDLGPDLLAEFCRRDPSGHSDITLVTPCDSLKRWWPPLFIGRRCVEVFPYVEAQACDRWFNALAAGASAPSRAVVTCMQKPFYEEWARRIERALQSLQRIDRRAMVAAHLDIEIAGAACSRFDEVRLEMPIDRTRDELAALLAEGFRVGFYCGHGRSRGFSGYRGLRWADLARPTAFVPGGVFVALTCSSLAFDKLLSRPIGIDWINSGRLAGFVGFTGPVRIEPLARLTARMLAELPRSRSVGEVLRRLHVGAVDDEVAQTLQLLRVVGSAQGSMA